jgi:hypothetical protein
VFTRIRDFLADLASWIWRQLRRPTIELLILAGGVAGVLVATGVIGEKKEPAPPPAPAPPVVIHEQAPPEEPQDLGFPAFATKNTTRISGADPTADAAGVSLAVFPSTGGVGGPAAVTLVNAEDWPAGVAAAALTAPPVSAPMLFTGDGELPSLTSDALAALAPRGSAATAHTQIFRVGAAPAVKGLRTRDVRGKSPAAVASAIDRLREELTGEQPEHIVVTTSDDPGYAMPAAAWGLVPATRCCSPSASRCRSRRSRRCTGTRTSRSTSSDPSPPSPPRRSTSSIT